MCIRDRRINTILKQLLISEEYIKLETIADRMWLNPQSISREMKEVRKMLGDYNLELISRPYRGMKIEGNEINYRFCYMDSICYYNHKVKMMDVFLDVDHKDQMEGEEREAIAKMVSDLICTREMGISDLETRKWIVMIILSEKRRKAGHFVSFSEEQAQLCLLYTSQRFVSGNQGRAGEQPEKCERQVPVRHPDRRHRRQRQRQILAGQ